MKRWVIKIGDKEHVCDLISANLVNISRLQMKYQYKQFMVDFNNRSEYLSSRDGNWNRVKIQNLTKSESKVGLARFI